MVVVGAAAALVELSPEVFGRRTGGPLACEGCGRTATAGPAEIGEVVSMGPLTLENEGSETVTLERIELMDVDRGLEFVGTLVVEPDGRSPLVGSGYGFPPRKPGGTTHSVRGYVLPPATKGNRFVQILVGIRLKTPGIAGARRMVVYYRAGDVPYRAFYDHSVWLCTDPGPSPRCIDPDWYER